MTESGVFTFFIILLLVSVLSAFLSDFVNEFRFKKLKDQSGEYEFEYNLESGEVFRGKTFVIEVPESHIYVMFGKNNVLYWVSFTDDEYQNKTTLSKSVRLVERDNDTLKFEDEFIQYELTISEGFLGVTPYQTLWDLERICFIKSVDGNQTFDYVTSATNNGRKYNGTTYVEAENQLYDPHIQRIHLHDGYQRNDVYEVLFTDKELNSNVTFCKGTSRRISEGGVLGAFAIANINPNLLKSLAG